jgi:hypothetical protein
MPDNQFEFLKNELKSIRLDMQSLQEKLSSIHQHLSICQSRCHVPGPSSTSSLLDSGRNIISKIIGRLL